MKRLWSSASLINATLVAGFVIGCNQAPRTQAPLPRMMPMASAPVVQSVPMASAPVVQQPVQVAQAQPIQEAPKAAEPTPTETKPALTAIPTSFARGPQDEARKSFVDTTAQPGFAHAPDYSWLTGEVQYSSISKSWRLRYASVEEDDTYGGSVTLSQESRIDGMKDGMIVRVMGQLEMPIERGIAPLYRAGSYQVVKQPMDGSHSTISLTGATVPGN